MRRPRSAGRRRQPHQIFDKEEGRDEQKPGVQDRGIGRAPRRDRIGEHDADPRRHHRVVNAAKRSGCGVRTLGPKHIVEALPAHAAF
jgi:hypothetical protein